MTTSFFPNLTISFLGILSGIIFGFLLRKAYVSRSDVIIGQLLLKDFTVLQVILTAIVTASVGLLFLNSIGFEVKLNTSTQSIILTIIGGGIFGIGMAVVGYCPGTMIASMGEGSKDAFYGFLGMLFGGYVYNFFYSKFKTILSSQQITNYKTLVDFFHIPQSVIILLLGMGLLSLYFFTKKKS
jgi:uncharacterized membrane protein YedE/YeeE